MGPKKVREPDDNFWRLNIEEAKLDDNDFKVKVIMIEAAGNDQDRLYLYKFETYAAVERRFVIKNICKTETIFMVNQLGGEKKIKDDTLRVFEEGQAYLKEKKDIPADILALIIKYLIIKMKDEYLFIKRQRLEVREGIRRESATMIDKAEVRGTVSVKASESLEPPPSAPKGKGKKLEQEPEFPEPTEGKKYNTMLRVRGEEWRDKVYIDDFPIDGPNLYVAVTGFVEPFLAGCLLNIGIPLTAIVQIRIDTENIKVPSTLHRATKRGQSQTELLMETSLRFWDDLQGMRIHKDTTDVYKTTAFVIFSPPYYKLDDLSGDPDKIYDEVCYLMYDLQDLTRQHKHYLENMTIIDIAQEYPDYLSLSEKYYHRCIDDIPLECVTTYSILDSILQAVSISQNIEESKSNTSVTASVTSNQILNSAEDIHVQKAQNLVKEMFNALRGTELNKKRYRVSYGEEYESHKDPTVINHGDFAKLPTFHLGNINLDNIVWSTLIGLPINKLWQNQDQPQGELEAKINFHVTLLLSCFERKDVETSELNRLIHILAFRKLYNNRSSLKKLHIPSTSVTEFKKRYLKRSILAEPLPRCPSLSATISSVSHQSSPSFTKFENEIFVDEHEEVHQTNFLFDCPDISELISATEIANNKPVTHIIDNFDFFEDFNGICAFQTLLRAFNKFNCIDYKYCEVTDCFVFMFFNNHDKDGIARDEWRYHLDTPLCLQDFFDFVLEENYAWIQNEEKMYDETINSKSLSGYKDVINPLATKACVENNDVLTELLMEGSLKHKELEELDECNMDISDLKTSSSGAAMTPASTDADTKGSRKTKSPISTTPKNVRKSFLASKVDSNISVVVPAKPFSGYNLGDRRVEILGKNAKYFSVDGTTVSSIYTLTIPMNLEYISLNVILGNEQNEFWIHKVLGDFHPLKKANASESFRVVSKNQVLFNIVKQEYQSPVLINIADNNMIQFPKRMESNGKSPGSEGVTLTMQPLFDTKPYHSFCVTWPNGLITESVHEKDSQEISHIKQFYVNSCKNGDEDMRCVSLNGEVVIFNKCGDIEVLRSDSTYIKITKCKKSPIIIVPEQQSETSSEKNKKGGKVKEKPKEKSSKDKSKSSKNNLFEDDKTVEIKPIEYEVIIDEYEIIEANGLRQQNVSGVFFDIERLLIRTATDYCLGEVFSRRMDHTNVLLNKDGIQIVTFPNNTRIITKCYVEAEEIYPEWTEEEIEYIELFTFDIVDTDHSNSPKSELNTSQQNISNDSTENVEEEHKKDVKKEDRIDGYLSVQIMYTIEHAKFATVTIDKGTGKITVDSPDGTTLGIDTKNNNSYSIVLDSLTEAYFDGKNLNIKYEACSQCATSTCCDITITKNSDENGLTDDEMSASKMWLKLNDPHGVTVVVNEEGAMSILNNQSLSSERLEAEAGMSEGMSEKSRKNDPIATVAEGKNGNKSETSVTSHIKCRELFQASAIRFFVLRRDLTCSELVNQLLVNEYKGKCRWKPWCAINQFNTFGDNRRLLSILTPIHLTETEKWVMDSKLADKPKHLTFKDLKLDTGKGFYHWMRPYDRFTPKPMKPDNALPQRLPKAFVLRTLEEQWSEDRDNLCGAKELLYAILRYRNILESDSETLLNINILEPRPQDERRIDDILQAMAHRVFEDLKRKLDEDVHRRANVSITSKPLPVSEVSFEGEEESTDEQWSLNQERSSLIKEVETAENVSPNLKKYWRRRAEELKEEEFFKYLLREGNVPPYFRNVLGGAIWWDMNYTANTAVHKAERKKWMCICQEASNNTD